MNLQETRNYLKQLVNRSDFTDALASQFLEQAQVRIERRLRINAMERMVNFTITGASFNVPRDLLEIVDIWTDGGTELERVDTSEYLRRGTAQAIPTCFFQSGRAVHVRPTPAAGTQFTMRYYAAQPRLSAPADDNIWSVSAIDALVYGAAELAGDYFEDERLARYAEKFNTALLELEEQAYREDFSGPMAVRPAYQI